MTDTQASNVQSPAPAPLPQATAIATGPAPAPVKPGWQTSEFWMRFVANALTVLYATGAIPTEGLWCTIAAIVATELGSLGYTVMRTQLKRAAVMASATSTPLAQRVAQSGKALASVMLVLALFAFPCLLAVNGCAWWSAEKGAVKTDAIDCTVGDAPKLVQEFAPVVDQLLQLSTAANNTLAGNAGAAFVNATAQVGGCVLADAAARLASSLASGASSGSGAAPLVVPVESVKALLGRRFPGQRWHTAHGDIGG